MIIDWFNYVFSEHNYKAKSGDQRA